jgi:hypothetical protein
MNTSIRKTNQRQKPSREQSTLPQKTPKPHVLTLKEEKTTATRKTTPEKTRYEI